MRRLDGALPVALYEAAALKLREAYSTGAVAPLREMVAQNDLEGAYAIQDINTRFWRHGGRRIMGYKIGLTSVALQQRLGVAEPDFGVLFEDMRIADVGVLPHRTVLQPRVEGEIAILLGRDVLTAYASRADVIEAIASAHPAIEIVGSRIRDWSVTAADTIADNASSGAFVVGNTPLLTSPPKLAEARMALRIHGKLVGEGRGDQALGDPLEALAWLARKAVARGHPLRAGDVVLTGSLVPMVPLPTNALVEVEIEGFSRASFRSES